MHKVELGAVAGSRAGALGGVVSQRRFYFAKKLAYDDAANLAIKRRMKHVDYDVSSFSAGF